MDESRDELDDLTVGGPCVDGPPPPADPPRVPDPLAASVTIYSL